MSLVELKREAARLSTKEQRELMAFLVAIQTEADQNFKEKLAARIDDRDPARWVELNDLRKKYGD
jgi:spore coat protein CotH